uniref:Uncharacterized protein n=1 Tax=Caenorhabditis japonica TaxID=281687 RepID=A0A8R1EHM0_CAEJA
MFVLVTTLSFTLSLALTAYYYRLASFRFGRACPVTESHRQTRGRRPLTRGEQSGEQGGKRRRSEAGAGRDETRREQEEEGDGDGAER